jgi:uncharacterized protein (DUF58 family)
MVVRGWFDRLLECPYDGSMGKVDLFFDPEVLARLKGLRLQMGRVVEGVWAGLHRSPRHGVSIDFAEHKSYTPGDDLRHMDWKVFGRLDRVCTKKYEEETNLQVTLVMDGSGSMEYSSGPFSKADYAGLLCASLAALLLHQGDAVGLMIQGGTQAVSIPPVGGTEHLPNLIAAIESSRPMGPTCIRRAVDRYMETSHRRGALVLFSDLFDPDPELVQMLKMVSVRRHEVFVFHVLDKDEVEFPFEDPTLFRSMEDERSLWTYPREVRDLYLKEMDRFLERIRKGLAEGGIWYEPSRTDEPPELPLLRCLLNRRTWI